MPLPGELLQARGPGGAELDRIDDELFATDYRSPTQTRHLTLLPEPPTVRLVQQAHVTWPGADPRSWPEYAPGGGPPAPSPWMSVPYPASEYSADENGTEIVLLVGIAVLLVVTVASAGVVLWWFA